MAKNKTSLSVEEGDRLVREHLATIHTDEYEGPRGPGGLPVVEEEND